MDRLGVMILTGVLLLVGGMVFGFVVPLAMEASSPSDDPPVLEMITGFAIAITGGVMASIGYFLKLARESLEAYPSDIYPDNEP